MGLTAVALLTSGAVYRGPASSATSAPEDVTVSAAPVTAAPVTAAPVTTGSTTGTASKALLARQARISRDSSRQALEDFTGTSVRKASGASAKELNAALAKLAASAEKAAAELTANRWVLPVAAGGYRLTARFGECSSLWAHCHTGLDFAAPSGAPVRAVAGGVVAETSYAGAYGNRTIIRLQDGTEIWYCHQTSFAVGAGQQVLAGQTIGTVGSTGNSTGPHLHLEVRPGGGDPVDPFQALVVHGLQP